MIRWLRSLWLRWQWRHVRIVGGRKILNRAWAVKIDSTATGGPTP